MDLSALADFHRVVAAGSLGKASRASDRPKATLSRHVRDLEESLGVRLIERGARALQLTAEGHALFDRTRGLLLDIEDAGRNLSAAGNRPRGWLRVSTPVMFANVWGGRLAAEFVARCPGVQVDLVASDRYVDMVEEGFDVVIRVNPDPASGLVGRCFARDATLVVASPSVPMPVWRGTQKPPVVPAVAAARAVAGTELWNFRANGRERRIAPDYRARLSTLAAARAAVLAGAGVARLPRSLVRADIMEGRMVAWGDYVARSVELWVLHTSRRLVSPKVSAFVAFLAESFPTREL
ncbi:MAG: LysR family transcriptional regulator [Rhodanobacteraceae bacterium]